MVISLQVSKNLVGPYKVFTISDPENGALKLYKAYSRPKYLISPSANSVFVGSQELC